MREERMHTTENLKARGIWEENILRGKWGTVKGLSPSLPLSWTKSLIVLGVSSCFFPTCSFQGSSKRKSSTKWPYGSSTPSSSKLPMASCRHGKVASSWVLCHRDKMQFSGSPAAGTEKWLFCYWQKIKHMKTCANFKNLAAWKQGRQWAWKH